jgi:hypothetical protein
VADFGLVEVSVLGRVVDRIATSGVGLTLRGGVWACEVPEKQDYPNVEVLSPRTDFQWSFEGLQAERPRFTVSAYAETANEAETIVRRALNALLDGDLGVTDTVTALVHPEDLSVSVAAGRGEGAKRYFVASAPIVVAIGPKML